MNPIKQWRENHVGESGLGQIVRLGDNLADYAEGLEAQLTAINVGNKLREHYEQKETE